MQPALFADPVQPEGFRYEPGFLTQAEALQRIAYEQLNADHLVANAPAPAVAAGQPARCVAAR